MNWSFKDLIRYQNERLRKIVSHAFNTVPYYNKLFESVRLHPDDVQTISDLSKIPKLSKIQIAKNTNDFFSTEPGDKVVFLNTSGSSGTPLKSLQHLMPLPANMQMFGGNAIGTTLISEINLLLLMADL